MTLYLNSVNIISEIKNALYEDITQRIKNNEGLKQQFLKEIETVYSKQKDISNIPVKDFDHLHYCKDQVMVLQGRIDEAKVLLNLGKEICENYLGD